MRLPFSIASNRFLTEMPVGRNSWRHISALSGRAASRAGALSVSGFGIALATIWGFHASAYSYPGRAYFSVTGLNDTSKPVGANMLLHPSFICALIIIGFTAGTSRRSARAGKCGIAFGMGCWLLGATLSVVANFTVEQVVLTYCSVFLAGAATYLATSRASLEGPDLEWGAFGLAVGSLFPLVAGLQAFIREWGTPDVTTALNAYLNLVRMELYESATFGNRGNTAAFLVIIAPFFLWLALDTSRTRTIRTICALMLIPILLNAFILQVRAAFITLVFSIAVVWGFRLGAKRYPLFAIGFGLTVTLLFQYSPDVTQMMSDRLRPVVTADTEGDTSLMGRTEAMKEGLAIAGHDWQYGIGPGGGLSLHSQSSAHQLELQQFMETGVLGLIGSIVFSGGILLMLLRTLLRGQDAGINNTRFTLLIGPASYVFYGVMANVTFNVGYVNTWTVIVASMLALVPPLEPRSELVLIDAAARLRNIRPLVQPI